MKLLPTYLDFMKQSNPVIRKRFRCSLSNWKNFTSGSAKVAHYVQDCL